MNTIPAVKPVSKAFYFGVYLGGSIVGIVLMIIGAVLLSVAEEGRMDSPAFGLMIGAGILLLVLGGLASVVILFVLYYKMWAAIQDGYARTTPGKAVGFMLIPFFNIYWMFQAVWGYAKDYNAYCQRYSIAVKPLSETLFLWSCILPLAGFVPFVGSLGQLANLIVSIIVINAICDSINALACAPQLQTPQIEVVEADVEPKDTAF